MRKAILSIIALASMALPAQAVWHVYPLSSDTVQVASAARQTTPAKTTARKAQYTCPVRGEEVPDIKTAQKSVYKGKTYYFCCQGCKPMFDKNPEKYIKATAARNKPAAKAMTCPMTGGKAGSMATTCPMMGGNAKATSMAMTCPMMGGKSKATSKTMSCPVMVSKAKTTPAAVKCPVMGGVVKNTKTAPKSVYKGKTYYFCCPDCKPTFDKNPENYIKPPKKH